MGLAVTCLRGAGLGGHPAARRRDETVPDQCKVVAATMPMEEIVSAVLPSLIR